jgi:hypothetical protein
MRGKPLNANEKVIQQPCIVLYSSATMYKIAFFISKIGAEIPELQILHYIMVTSALKMYHIKTTTQQSIILYI